jgi:hypothetical protein
MPIMFEHCSSLNETIHLLIGETSMEIEYDEYHFQWKGSSLSAKTVRTWKAGYGIVRWREQKHEKRQKLHLPKGWWPELQKSLIGLPSMLLWQPGGDSIVLMIATCESGTWEFRSPIPYIYRKSHWEAYQIEPKCLEFSNQGGFYVEHDRINVWDVDYDERTGHVDDQRYRLRVYQWCNHGLELIRNAVTKKKYPVFGLAFIGNEVVTPPKKEDPLVELRLRWKWWESPVTQKGKNK